VGGCIGNNAAGARSIRYGRTSENIAGIEVLLATGERLWLEPGAGARDATAHRLAAGVIDIVRRHADLIRRRFPKTIRRNAGYGLDLILSQLDAGATPETLDLAGLLCGSEGTLAVTLAARLKLHPIPRAKGLAVVAFPSVDAAIAAVGPILETKPTAVELLDDVVLDAARGNVEYRRYVDLLPDAYAKAVLYVEYFGFAEGNAESAIGPAREQVRASFATLRSVVGDAPMLAHEDAAAMLQMWKLRKAGEPLLHGLGEHGRKPMTFVEDNAVPVERLGEFVRRFREICDRHGTRAAYWAHASVGVLHIRPMVDIHSDGDRRIVRAIAQEAADLARECGGVMSGEHGDGRVRGPLLERFFGPELMNAFREVKRLFDPGKILNPGMEIAPGPVESITENLRVRPGPASDGARSQPAREVRVPPVETFFDYRDQEDFAGAVEMCNGAGVCRKRRGGTMCPSYMALMDERHATRGRGNALRLAITGQFGSGSGPTGRSRDGSGGEPVWDDPGTIETLDLCLSCKACKSECPSNVDIARLKAEYTAQRYAAKGSVPLASRLMGHVRALNQLGAFTPRLANVVSGLSPVRALLGAVLDVHPKRSLPKFSESLYSWKRRRERGQRADPYRAAAGPPRPRLVLFGDCFTCYNESHIGRAAVTVLEALGYDVVLPAAEGLGAGCCARPMISLGLLPEAIQTARSTINLLRSHVEPGDGGDAPRAVLFLEPSCLSAVKDDWLALKIPADRALRERLAERSTLVEDFVARFWDDHPVPGDRAFDAAQLGEQVQAIFHGHCHQKSLFGSDTSTAALHRLLGPARVRELDSGCCGMAGAFGFARHRFDLSMQIGGLTLLPAAREARPGELIVAPGASCRHQVHDGAGRTALHPVEVLALALRNSPVPARQP
jgi:FAD/FMN-containing dehydrogenase/Fe-S oxidoreductase